MSDIAILLVGKTDRSEFRRAAAALEGFGRVASAADVETAIGMLAQRQIIPELIVMAQSYPGEFSHPSLDRLQRLAPLSRVLGLLGSWCEGEMRSGDPWPAAVRVYWHQWCCQAERQLGRMVRDACCTWGLPVTATEEERILSLSEQPTSRREGLIAIHTWRREMEDWLSAALRRRGYSTVWLRGPRLGRVEGACGAIFNGSECRGEERDELGRLAAMVAPAGVIALLDFPRIEDHDRAISAGAAAVVSKPLQVEDLFWQLDRVLQDSTDLDSS